MSGRSAIVLVVLVVTLWSVLGPAAAAGPASAGSQNTGASMVESGLPSGSASLAQAENNSTIRHRDPSTTNEEGNLSKVSSVLAGQMGEIVVDCSEGVRIGNYDACEELNGSYSDSLSKYVDVTGRDGGGGGDGDGGGDDRTETFRETRNRTQNYTDTVQEYRSTYEQYREARRNGNTTRARRLARELLELRSEADRQSRLLNRSLERTGDVADVNTSDAQADVAAVTENITEQTTTVQETLFDPARLRLRDPPDGGSFTDPLSIGGRVSAPNGTGLADARVVLLVDGGGRTARTVATTRTNATGAFGFEYRPTTVRTGNRSFVVRYLPRPTSQYLAAESGFDARIEQTDARLEVDNVTETAGYRDRVRARARLVAGGEPVPDVPVVLTVDGQQLATARTNMAGETRVAGRLPASIATGDQQLRLAFAARDRALTPVNASRTLQVEATATELSLRVVQVEPGSATVRVRGRLRTADGTPLGDRTVAIDAGGERVTSLRTDADGRFRRTLNVSSGLLPDEEGAVRNTTFTASFAPGAGTNLDASRATLRVPLRTAEPPAEPGLVETVVSLTARNPVLVAGAVGVLILVGLSGAVLLRREESGGTTAGTGGGTPAGGSTDEQTAAEVPSRTVESLESAQTALADGAYARAVFAGYAAARDALSGGSDGSSATHWEFYRTQAESGLDDDRLTALQGLTEAFERTTYAGEQPGRDLATDAVDSARSLVGADADEALAADGSGPTEETHGGGATPPEGE